MKLDKPSSIVGLSGSDTAWRVGDWAEVRSLTEILVTLDERATLSAMPFMPEMIPFCGRRFQVMKVAHKTCDSSGWEYLRSLTDCIHLDLRCNGLHHGGCQAGCLFFWKTAWLRKVKGPLTGEQPDTQQEDVLSSDILERLCCVHDDFDTCYRCQATELKNAALPLHPWDLSQYVQDLKSGNVRLLDFMHYGALAVLKTIKVHLVKARKRLKSFFGIKETLDKKTPPSSILDLQPGDKVRIKTWPEIAATLNDERRHTGLLFDPDMVQHCGTTQEIARRVERIIDEKTGKMMHFSTSSVILKDVACTGLNCRMRLFCPRGQCNFWRDAWLEKAPVEEPAVSDQQAPLTRTQTKPLKDS